MRGFYPNTILLLQYVNDYTESEDNGNFGYTLNKVLNITFIDNFNIEIRRINDIKSPKTLKLKKLSTLGEYLY